MLNVHLPMVSRHQIRRWCKGKGTDKLMPLTSRGLVSSSSERGSVVDRVWLIVTWAHTQSHQHCSHQPQLELRIDGEGFSFILDFEVLEHWTLNFFFIHCSWFKVFKETRRNVGRWDSIFNPLQICVMTNHLLEHSVLKITTWLCLVNSVGAVSSVHTLKGGWVTWLDSWHVTAASHLPRLGRTGRPVTELSHLQPSIFTSHYSNTALSKHAARATAPILYSPAPGGCHSAPAPVFSC